jgi:hypothetical protein
MRNKQASQKSNPVPDDYVTQDSWGVDPPPEGGLRPTVSRVDVLPYRGQEYHGVNPNLAGPPPDINADVFDQTMVVPEPQEKPDPDIRPVPVRVVKNDDQWETTIFRTFQNLVGPGPTRIVGHQKDRTTCILKNDDAAGSIWISNDPQPNVVNSFLLKAGGQMTINGTNAVWASSADANSYPLSTYVEVTVTASKQQEA